MAANWSDLPPELLHLIGLLLDNPSSETRHFRAVCSSWRSALPRPAKPHDFLSPPIKFLSSQAHHCDLLLAKHTVFLVRPLSPGPPSFSLIKAEETEPNPGALSLLNPFSRKGFIQHASPTLDLTNLNTIELSHEYVLRTTTSTNGDQECHLHNMEDERVAFALEPNDAKASGNFVLLATHSNTGKLLMYRSSTQEWEFLDDFALGYDDRSIFVNDWALRYVDVAHHRGKFYAVTDSGRTVTIEQGGKDSSVVVTLMVNSIIGGDKKRLVKSGDDLLLVDFSTCSTREAVEVNSIDVFKLDKESKRWVLLKDLGGLSLFVSDSSSFSTSDLPRGNCIYYYFKPEKYCLEEKYEDIGDGEGREGDHGLRTGDVCVFDYENGSVRSLDEQEVDSRLFQWPPTNCVG